MRSVSSIAMTPKPTRVHARHLDAADGHVRRQFDVLPKHQLVVHLVDVVARQHDHVGRRVARDDVDVLVDGVGRAGVPHGLRHALARRQDVEALVALGAEEVPAALQMADQAVRLVLRCDPDPADAGVERVGQCEVDDPRLPPEIDSGLGALVGQLHQPAAASTCEHIRHRVACQRPDAVDVRHHTASHRRQYLTIEACGGESNWSAMRAVPCLGARSAGPF